MEIFLVSLQNLTMSRNVFNHNDRVCDVSINAVSAKWIVLFDLSQKERERNRTKNQEPINDQMYKHIEFYAWNCKPQIATNIFTFILQWHWNHLARFICYFRFIFWTEIVKLYLWPIHFWFKILRAGVAHWV